MWQKNTNIVSRGTATFEAETAREVYNAAEKFLDGTPGSQTISRVVTPPTPTQPLYRLELRWIRTLQGRKK